MINDHLYEGRFTPRVNGKRISKNVYAKTREECEEKLAELIKTMKAENRLSQVRQADNSEMLDKKFDAKEKGDNQYAGDGGRGKKKAPAKQTDGKVILKGAGSFDMKI